MSSSNVAQFDSKPILLREDWNGLATSSQAPMTQSMYVPRMDGARTTSVTTPSDAVTASTSSVASSVSSASASSATTPAMFLSQSVVPQTRSSSLRVAFECDLIPGEVVRHSVEQCTWDSLPGALLVTNFRLIHRPQTGNDGCAKRGANDVSLAIGMLDVITLNSDHSLHLSCKYFREVVLSGWKDCRAGKGIRDQLLFLIRKPFATTVGVRTLQPRPMYSITQEARRWGICIPQPVAEEAGVDPVELPGGAEDSGWRLCLVNRTYEVCSSYPSHVFVPSRATDDDVKLCAKFRSRSRFPALSWRCPHTRVSLTRCAQPLTGLLRNRSSDDEAMIDAIREAQGPHANLVLIDCRPVINAYANQAKGGGTEIMGNYDGRCRLINLGVANIHQMRSSLRALSQLCRLHAAGDATHGWHSGLEATGWMGHVSSVLQGAVRVATILRSEQTSVLVHCSDGWDRTSQLTSLAQLLVDPWARTLDGFQALIEREWLSFGHRFGQRSAHGKLGYWGRKDCSPIFLQFLDCVYQLQMQFPTAFEFDQVLLVVLADMVFSARYADFMGNTEADRVQHLMNRPSMWRAIRADFEAGNFRNHAYEPTPLPTDEASATASLLTPCTGAMSLVLFKLYCLRFLSSMWKPSGGPSPAEGPACNPTQVSGERRVESPRKGTGTNGTPFVEYTNGDDCCGGDGEGATAGNAKLLMNVSTLSVIEDYELCQQPIALYPEEEPDGSGSTMMWSLSGAWGAIRSFVGV